MEANNSRNLLNQGIQIANDRSIIHKALIDIREIAWKSTDFNELKSSDFNEEHMKTARQMTGDLYLLLNIGSLHTIWNILSKLQVNSESRISTKEACWRKNDLDLDIQDVYAASIPKCIGFHELLNKPFDRKEGLINVQKFCSYIDNLILRMDDLDRRLIKLMNLIKPSSVHIITTRLCELDQLEVIIDVASRLTKKIKLKAAGKYEIQAIARLIRRMYIFLHEAKVTELSPVYQERFDYIMLMKDSPARGHERFQKIIDDMQILQEDVNEHNSTCKMKCGKFETVLGWIEVYGESANNHCSRKSIKFISDLSEFFDDILQRIEWFCYRFAHIKRSMNVT